MTDIKKVKEEIIKNIKIGLKDPPARGGQHVGLMPTAIKLESEELALEISVGFHRGQIRNKELAYDLFIIALDELVF